MLFPTLQTRCMCGSIVYRYVLWYKVTNFFEGHAPFSEASRERGEMTVVVYREYL